MCTVAGEKYALACCLGEWALLTIRGIQQFTCRDFKCKLHDCMTASKQAAACHFRFW